MSIADRLAAPLGLAHRLADPLRAKVAGLLATDAYDTLPVVKKARSFFGTLNDLTGRPFCTLEEAERRRARTAAGQYTVVVEHEPAPVMLYFDGKDHRTKQKMEDLLKNREIPFKTLDVTDDEASRSWAQTTAHQNEFPLVFIAGEPIGGLHELTQLDVNGTLRKRVFGGG